MTYALIALGAANLLQLALVGLLLRRRRDLDLSRVEQRLAHYGDALALLTDTTQTGFASVAAELERAGSRRTPTVARATTKRIVGAAKKGRSVQDIAASEEVSESEIRLHLGLASDLDDERPPVQDAPRPSKATRGRSAMTIGA